MPCPTFPAQFPRIPFRHMHRARINPRRLTIIDPGMTNTHFIEPRELNPPRLTQIAHPHHQHAMNLDRQLRCPCVHPTSRQGVSPDCVVTVANSLGKVLLAVIWER